MKQKVDHTDESTSWDIESLEDLLDAWHQYLNESSNKHEYCLEKHHVIECGYSIKRNPTIPEEVYNQVGLSKECTIENPLISCIKFSSKVLDYMKAKSWKGVEAAVIGSQDEKLELLEFLPGEYLLKSSQEKYNADGCIIDDEGNEVFVLETSRKLMLNEKWEYGYDHVKCTFEDSLHLWVLELYFNKLYISNKAFKCKIPENMKDIKNVLALGNLLWCLKQAPKQKPVKGEGYGILLPEEKDENDCSVRFTGISK
ncbi:hypothetical protein CU097_015346 [Rhizopus azygosporus]|uniref:Uncharacterized protein n=1 Tax=Rhizopus azygosporus TaxID=86630 RepID=A0A367KB01_RHIAZ|nr:hypothetical protein CU097_015346 [Rhizopus azygosporus]